MRAGPEKAIQLAFYSSLRDNRVIFVVMGGVGLKENDKVYFCQEKNMLSGKYPKQRQVA